MKKKGILDDGYLTHGLSLVTIFMRIDFFKVACSLTGPNGAVRSRLNSTNLQKAIWQIQGYPNNVTLPLGTVLQMNRILIDCQNADSYQI